MNRITKLIGSGLEHVIDMVSVINSGRSGTPPLPGRSGKRVPRTRAKAPNDGRWHMKYHRNRVRR